MTASALHRCRDVVATTLTGVGLSSKKFTPQWRAGSGEPVLLIHGSSVSWTIWRDVIPLLSGDFDVLAPTLGGHGGGAPLPAGPVTVATYADSIEAVMDAAGWPTAHLVGSSLGGWTAMELAQRGRARSVIAFSPAGGWPDDRAAMRRTRRFFVSARRQVRLTLPLARIAMRFRLVRKLALRGTAVHGDRVSTEHALELLDLVLAYDERMIQVLDSPVRALPDPGIPGLIAWCGRDRLIPTPTFSDPWRAAAPWAEFRVLPGVGHSVMYDDPQLVASTICDWIRSA